jgi:hypothetical protein
MKRNRVIGVVLVMGGVFLVSTASQRKPMKQFLNPAGVPKPTGYSQVVSSRQGRMIFISGQGGASVDGQMGADFASQTSDTFENIGRCLAAGQIRGHCQDQLLSDGPVKFCRTSPYPGAVSKPVGSTCVHVGAGRSTGERAAPGGGSPRHCS